MYSVVATFAVPSSSPRFLDPLPPALGTSSPPPAPPPPPLGGDLLPPVLLPSSLLCFYHLPPFFYHPGHGAPREEVPRKGGEEVPQKGGRRSPFPPGLAPAYSSQRFSISVKLGLPLFAESPRAAGFGSKLGSQHALRQQAGFAPNLRALQLAGSIFCKCVSIASLSVLPP